MRCYISARHDCINKMEKVTRNAAVYFLAQGFAVAGWWVVLITVPRSRSYFQLEADSLTTLWAFWLPDLILIGPLSIVSGLLITVRNRFASSAAWMVTGAVSYATLYTLAMVMMTDAGWLGVVLMLPAMLWSGVFATALSVRSDMFREARPSSSNYVLVKTFTQIVLVWSVILLIFPYLITIVEDKIGIVRLEFAGQGPIASLLFGLLSIPGVWSAIVMSRIGRGTPLPLDHARELVVQGPYSFVRNPMALSGIGQGLAVALFLGSPLVAVYALMGSAIWQLIFRPLEEDDLMRRFGPPYEDYKNATKCWVPRLKAYQIDGTADSSNSVDRPSGSI